MSLDEHGNDGTDPDRRWARAAADLKTYREAQRARWGDVDEEMVARFVVGSITTEERDRVVQAMHTNPLVREWVETVRDVLGAAQSEARPGDSRARGPQPAIRAARFPFEQFRKLRRVSRIVAGRPWSSPPDVIPRPDQQSSHPSAQPDPPVPVSRGRPRLIDAMVIAATILVAIALVVPAIGRVREADRRTRCINNLKQLALAVHNYINSDGVFPPGVQWQRDPNSGYCWTSGSCLVPLMQYGEQAPLFNAINFNVNMYNAANTTISGADIATLWCPSDPKVADLYTYPAGRGALDTVPLPMHYTSYGANAGEFFILDWSEVVSYGQCAFSLDGSPGQQQMNGVVYALSHVRLANITDGTSNTFLFAERAHGKLPASDRITWNWWTSGVYGDTMFTTFYGMNTFNKGVYSKEIGLGS
jgi:hypothetical protein